MAGRSYRELEEAIRTIEEALGPQSKTLRSMGDDLDAKGGGAMIVALGLKLDRESREPPQPPEKPKS